MVRGAAVADGRRGEKGMSLFDWGEVFRQHVDKGMDYSDAAHRADLAKERAERMEKKA